LIAKSFKQDGVINEEIDLDDMEYDEGLYKNNNNNNI